jgi:hypothetical protein
MDQFRFIFLLNKILLKSFSILIKAMCDVTRPYVDSFNWMLKEGLMKAAGVSRKKLIFSEFYFLLYRPFYH